MRYSMWALVIAWSLTTVGAAQAASSVGQLAPNFTLSDTSGKSVSLTDFKGKTVVLEWVNPGCPFVQKHYKSANLPNTQKAAVERAVVWLAVNSTAPGTTDHLSAQAMADWMIAQGFGPIAFLLVVNILLLLAGNVMEPSSIILILAPILFPVAMKLGIDPIHFGILIVVNMEVGMCHPPVGLNLYVASGITKMGISELTIAVMPWLLTMLGFLMVVTYWPSLTLWLPHLSGYR